MMQLQMRCHALQERFDDQSATLKLARESHGDMQVSISMFSILRNTSSPSGTPDCSGDGVFGEGTPFLSIYAF